jgi:hypothetical protein
MEEDSMKSETYVVLKDHRIVKVYTTTSGLTGIKESLKNQPILSYDSIIRVEGVPDYVQTTDIREYDENGKLRPLEDRIIDGFVPVPRGKKIVDKTLVNKTIVEKIADGDIKLEYNQKYDEERDEIVYKTEMELEEEEVATMSEDELIAHNEQKAIDREIKLIDEEIRRIAMERLKQRGEI